jgi:serine/threonine protein kinase
MSEVYLAKDELMQRDVAVKVVSSAHADYIERFRREASAIGNLQHDHILPAYDFGEQTPWHYLVMPYIDYCTLADKLKEQGPLSLEEAGELLQQIAGALQFAHDHGVIHRDIKPSNILLRDDHYAYLADFGLAKSMEGTSKVTQTGVLLGTPEYMAPELADGPAGTGSDIYALGILLYQMLTGRTPFSGDSALAIYLKQMREQPLPPSRFNPAIPPSVDRVILRALEKDPRRRYSSASQLAQAYLRALEEKDAPAFSESAVSPTPVLFEPVESLDGSMPHTPDFLGPTVQQVPAQPTANAYDMPPEAVPANPVVLPGYQPGTQYARSGPGAVRARRTSRPISAPIPRRVPARRTSRSSTVGISFLIGLVVLLVIGAVFYIFYSGYNAHRSTTPGVTSTVPGGATSSASATGTAQTSATAQQSGQATVTAITSASPLLRDPLSGNTRNRWPNDGTACAFTGGAYHVLVSKSNFLQPCTSPTLTYGNVAIQVDVTLNQGSDAGVLFRVNGLEQFYDFEITSQGEFYFRRHDLGGGSNYTFLIPRTASSAIANGSKNTLFILANGSNFAFYINGTFAGQAQDSTYASGQLGFVAGTLTTDSSADASFSNLVVYPVS